MMNELIVSGLLISGGIFMLLAAVGVLRMPDVYMRISTATKAATLGAGCTLLAAAVHFGTISISSRALAILVFIFLTAPVSAHVIGRAAYIIGVPLWEGTAMDDLQGRYDPSTGELDSRDAAEPPASPTNRAT